MSTQAKKKSRVSEPGEETGAAEAFTAEVDDLEGSDCRSDCLGLRSGRAAAGTERRVIALQ